MASMQEMRRIELTLGSNQHSRKDRSGSLQLVSKMRTMLASGRETTEVKRKLEQLIGRFSSAHF